MRVLMPAAIALAAVLLYAPTLDHDLVGLDDYVLVLKDEAYNRDPASFLGAFGSNFFDRYYRPLHRMSFVLDAQLGGTDLVVYHRTNLLLHSLAALLVFAALRALGSARPIAFLLGLVFAVHPVLVSVVAWIPGRDNALLTIFLLTSLIALDRTLESGPRARAGWLVLHWLGFAAALFTKEVAVVFPIVAAAFAVLYHDRPLRSRPVLVLAAGWLAVGAIFLAARSQALPGARDWEAFGLASLIGSIPTIFAVVGKVVLPLRLTAFADHDALSVSTGIAATGLIAFFVARSPRVRRRRVLFGAVWFAVLLAPTLAQRTGLYDYGEYRVHWLMFGLLVVAAEILRGLAVDLRRPASVVLGVLVVVGLAGRTLAYQRVFDGRQAFWSQKVRVDPWSGWGWFNLGRSHYMQGEIDQAVEAYERALDVGFTLADLHTDLAAVRLQQREYDAAAAQALRALAIDPGHVQAHFNLGLARLHRGEFEAAVQEFAAVIENPRAEASLRAGAQDYLGSCYYALGRGEEARDAWTEAISWDPDRYGPYVKLVRFHLDAGGPEAARALAAELVRHGGRLPPPLQQRLDRTGS